MADPTITGTGAVKRAEFKLFADVEKTIWPASFPNWPLNGIRTKTAP